MQLLSLNHLNQDKQITLRTYQFHYDKRNRI